MQLIPVRLSRSVLCVFTGAAFVSNPAVPFAFVIVIVIVVFMVWRDPPPLKCTLTSALVPTLQIPLAFWRHLLTRDTVSLSASSL